MLWRAAFDDFRAHPVVGSGAGSFGRWWLAHRTTAYFVEDAHNLYVQTLAEGGVIGFALLAALLGLPLIAAVRARRHPLVAPAFGAYVAFLVHCAVDWDWQMPAVTLLALFAAAALDRGRSRRRAASASAPGAVAGGARRAAARRRGRRVRRADREHRARTRRARGSSTGSSARRSSSAAKAHRWAPWSAQALRALGESQRARSAETRRAGRAAAGGRQGSGRLADLVRHRRRHVRCRAPRSALARVRSLNPHGPELAAVARAHAAVRVWAGSVRG